MLNSRLLRKQDALLHFELMAYLIRQFGAPPRPTVPSLLRRTPGWESLAWDPSDTRSIFHWALDYFTEIKSACHMHDLKAELFPEGSSDDAEHMVANHRVDALAAGRMPYRKSGIPAVIYDPSYCSQTGYFTATIALQLAEFRVKTFEPETPPSPTQRQKMRLTAAAYNRQGFVLANLLEQVSDGLSRSGDKRTISQKEIQNTLCFSTCLSLRIRRQSAEQIVASYGTRMTPNFRRKIPLACRQIDSHADTLEVLQMLADRKVGQRPALQLVKRGV